MSNLSKILQEEYKKKKSIVTPQSLIEMIEEMMGEFSQSLPQPIKEMSSRDTSRTYHISEIPMIPISELGWANADEDALSDDPNVPPSQRQGLEQYLSKIPGTGFADKLNAVSDIMREGINSIPKDNPREFIQQAMAYLVFYKTLTMAITNFNASAAGFNFEAFLAALMDGKQIPASGAQTIADITANVDGERIPISLKLYSDKGLEVGGSFFDLCNDMLEPNDEWEAWVKANPEFEGGAMRYIACTKTLDGVGVEQEGHIDFYQFDITRKNLFQLLSVTDAGRKAILSNTTFMAALTEYMKTGQQTDALNWAENIPARSDTSNSAEISSLWSDYLSQTDVSSHLQKAGVDQEQEKAILDTLVKIYTDSIETTQSANTLAADGPLGQQIALALNSSPSSEDKKVARGIRNQIVKPLFKQFKKDVIRGRDARAQFLDKSGEWVTGAPVVEWYTSLTPELKAMAIKNTKGYLTRSHWVLSRGATIKLGGSSPFAKLQIGARYVVKVLESARGELMDEVFSIFEQMTRMSQELNAFFANGLEDPQKAEAGAEAGEDAAQKARRAAAINE